MTKEERLSVLLADTLCDVQLEKNMARYWMDKCVEKDKRLDEFSDAFADLVKELTDANQKLDRYYIAYGKPKQVRA